MESKIGSSGRRAIHLQGVFSSSFAKGGGRDGHSSVRRSKVDRASAAALASLFQYAPSLAIFSIVKSRSPLATTANALSAWTITPEAKSPATLEIVAGAMLALRLSRWRSAQTLRDPLLWSLRVGYAWLSLGLLIESFNGFFFNYCRKKRRYTR